jgi:hypothetical protein
MYIYIFIEYYNTFKTVHQSETSLLKRIKVKKTDGFISKLLKNFK